MCSGFIIIQFVDDQDFIFIVFKVVIDSFIVCGWEDWYIDVIFEYYG